MTEPETPLSKEKRGHVVFLTPAFPPHIGGVEKHTSRVSQELAAKGYKVTVVTRKSSHYDRDVERCKGIQIYRVNKKHPFTLAWWLYRNRKSLHRVDIIHCHDLEPLIIWLLPVRLLFLGSKVFLTLHGFDRYPIPIWAKVLRRLGLKVVRSSVCVGSFIERWYGLKCSSLIVGGVDIPEETTDPPGGPTSATFVGRLATDTGFGVYVDALTILKSKGIDIMLDVCGDGPLREEMEKLCKERALPVRFHGFTPSPERFVRNARFVFATGFLSILEGMANRRAVFSVFENDMKKDYLASIPDVSHTVFVASNAESLAETLVRVLSNPEEERAFIIRGRKFAESQGWDRIAELYDRLYKS